MPFWVKVGAQEMTKAYTVWNNIRRFIVKYILQIYLAYPTIRKINSQVPLFDLHGDVSLLNFELKSARGQFTLINYKYTTNNVSQLIFN